MARTSQVKFCSCSMLFAKQSVFHHGVVIEVDGARFVLGAGTRASSGLHDDDGDDDQEKSTTSGGAGDERKIALSRVGRRRRRCGASVDGSGGGEAEVLLVLVRNLKGALLGVVVGECDLDDLSAVVGECLGDGEGVGPGRVEEIRQLRGEGLSRGRSGNLEVDHVLDRSLSGRRGCCCCCCRRDCGG